MLQEAWPKSTGVPAKESVWDEWLAELTPRDEEAKCVHTLEALPHVGRVGSGDARLGESVKYVRAQADDAAGPRRDFPCGKENAVENVTEEKLVTKDVATEEEAAGSHRRPASSVEEKKPVIQVATNKNPGTLRGRRVLSMDGHMCTLSLFERDGLVRIEAAMRIGGKCLRGRCEVPDATTDAWAVWARTDVRVLDSALSVVYA